MSSDALKFEANASSGINLIILGSIAVGAGVIRGLPTAVAFGVTLLVLNFLTWFLLRRSASMLELRQDGPESAVEGDRVDISISLVNRGRIPLFHVRVSEVFGPEFADRKDLVFPAIVGKNSYATRSYTGHCLSPRGIYPIGPTFVRVCDPFGWFEIRLQLSSDAELKVYPRIPDVRVRDRLGRAQARLMQDILSPRVGHSTEFRSVREYRPGDARRRIHWRSSARRGELVVRETLRETSGKIVVVFEKRPDTNEGGGRNSPFERSIRVAAALGAHAIESGRSVSVVTGSRQADRFEPRGQRNPLMELLDHLVELRADGRKSIVKVCDELPEDVVEHARVCVILPPEKALADPVAQALGRLATRAGSVTAVLLDPSRLNGERRPGLVDQRQFANRAIDVVSVPYSVSSAAAVEQAS